MPKELSASQSEFFKDSKIRSKDGRLLVMYHGSDSDFDEFSTPLAWFSADRRYASEYGSRIYVCYLDCRRPFACGDTSLPLFDSGMSADDVDAGFMQALSLGDGIDDIDFEDDAMDGAPLAGSRSPVPSAAAEALRAKAKIGKAEFDATLKDVRSQYSDPDADPNGWELRLDALTRSSEFKDALAARGYDSIVAREEGHLCVAAFRPESIKLVSNANPTRSRKTDEGKNACEAVCGPKTIRTANQSSEGPKSPTRPSRGQNGLAEAPEGPSKGRSLSKGQEDFFRNSKIRDGDGNLLVCYHGTEHPGFGSFDSRKGSSQFGRHKFRNANVNYFTTSEDVAVGYTDMGVREGGNVYACYLNVENPYVLDAKGQGFNGLVDDGLWMVRSDILDRIASEAWTDGELGRLNELLSYLTVHLEPTGRKDSDGNAVYDLHRDTNGFTRGVIMREYTLDELLLDEDAYAELRGEVLGSQDDYYLTTDDVINAVLYMNDYKGENYDGVVFENIADKGPRGMLFGADATDIATLKSANQIKRISNLNPTGADGLDEEAPNAELPSRKYKGSENSMKVSTQAELDEFLRGFDEALSEPTPEEHWVEDVVLEDFDKGGKARKLTALNDEQWKKLVAFFDDPTKGDSYLDFLDEAYSKPSEEKEPSGGLHERADDAEDSAAGVDEDIEVHDALNPALFDGDELKPEVKEAVKRIADEFVDMLRQDGIKFRLKDIVLVGSNMSYNYTKDSDLDIHLIADSKTLHCPDGLYPLLYSAYRSMFNSKYDITIKGIPAEVYVEVI